MRTNAACKACKQRAMMAETCLGRQKDERDGNTLTAEISTEDSITIQKENESMRKPQPVRPSRVSYDPRYEVRRTN